ncbi:ATP-dependent helicase [Clostridium tyrobutyricum]|uniref:ATP-dependent helicase n=1 Tax=Clostridium tyrobutyricum TaxID=1519 RepID=UPI0010AA4E85|nr:ATP-dependent helicase [Clostridium tyrobutyricum]QCH27613.1 Putative ATP-dependent DNA helicase YjcD [Clostridium tyrobutyricum]
MFKDKQLDEKQREAVYTEYTNVEVCAPPGSGKTTVIINRVCHLIEDMKVDPLNIVVITFTKSAAHNMKNRYLAISKYKDKIPFFGTFHSLFYKILLEYKHNINIIEEDYSFKIIKNVLKMYLDCVPRQKIREILNDISMLKNKNSSIDNFKSKTDKSVFIHCFNSYEKYKLKNNLLDFDDIQLQAKKLFINNENILNRYRKIFKYVLVDEFQDCDELQLKLLQLVCLGNSIFAVGDEDQCIYGFRGSNPSYMVGFDKYFSEGKKLFLNLNYRSVKNVVELSKNLIMNNKNRNLKSINANKKFIGKIEFFRFEGEYDEANYISKKIIEIVGSNNYNYRNIAILYRTNIESRNIISNFLKRNIKFKFLNGSYNFFEHFICMDIIDYLNISIMEYDADSFANIINKPYRYISKINIAKVKKYPYRENCFDILSNIRNMPVFQIKKILKLKKIVSRFKKMPLDKVIDTIIYKIGYINYLEKLCKKNNIDIAECENILQEFKMCFEKFNDISEFLEYVKKFSNSIKESIHFDNAVILSSIHGVKGMEFDNVFIINCNEEIIPHVNSIPKSLEEERRLFYVAITRAIDNLYIYSVENICGKPKEASRFLDELCNSI